MTYTTSEGNTNDWDIYVSVSNGIIYDELDFIRDPLCFRSSDNSIRRDTSDSSCGGSDDKVVDTYTNLSATSLKFNLDDMGNASDNSDGITDLINSLSYEKY